jgi:hypothetical protein
VKKSNSITLTVIASLGIVARAQQAPIGPAAPVAPQGCEEQRKAARASGAPVVACGHSGSGAHAASRGGFGAIGKGHSGGG